MFRGRASKKKRNPLLWLFVVQKLGGKNALNFFPPPPPRCSPYFPLANFPALRPVMTTLPIWLFSFPADKPSSLTAKRFLFALSHYRRFLPHWQQWSGARCWWRSWLRHCATIRKVAGSIPDGVIGNFH